MEDINNNRDNIQDLDTRRICRMRLPVFFGSNENYQHGAREVLGNSVDEINNNFESGEITFELYDDNETVCVTDTGRGIPIEGTSKGKPNYVLLFETLFAGTNYNNVENKKITAGTNGVGTCVLNHTSDLFLVQVCRNKKVFELKYENGGNRIHMKEIGEGNDSYTKIIFKLSKEVYTNTVYNSDSLQEICKNFSATNPKVNIIYKYKDKEVKYHYDNLLDFFNENASDNLGDALYYPPKKYEHEYEETETDKETLEKRIVKKVEENTVELLMTGTNGQQPFQQTYLNGIYLTEEGKIYDGVIAGAKNFIHRYLKEKNMYDKKEKVIKEKDIINSLNFICDIKSTNVSYSNQTKFSTKKDLYKEIARDYVEEYLEVYKAEQPLDMEKIAKQVLISKRIGEKTDAYMEKTKKKLTEKVNNIDSRVVGFIDCKNHGPLSSIFINEGKSALGTIISARDADYQCGYALRGKLLNILKADYEKIFANEEITDLIKILGCGIEIKKKEYSMFDISKLRYGRIVIATDQDNDGFHIQCLVLTFFYKLMPTLIKEGHIYILDTPLYEIRDLDSDDVHYAFSDVEKNSILSNVKNYQINRNKGLGEVDAETMAKCMNNPATVRRVEWDEAEEIVKWFDVFMGDNLEERKEYMEENLPKYIEDMRE